MTIHWQEIRSLRRQAQGLHRTLEDDPITWEIYEGVLDFLFEYLRPQMNTLETGVGLSTLVFAQCQTHHVAITPRADEVQRIHEVSEQHDIPSNKIEWKIGQSENILPNLATDPDFDLILIDGGHGFPTPFIDWFYSAQRLRTGGILIIDDINLPTVHELYRFLRAHPHWNLIHNYAWQSAVFRKVSPHAGRQLEDWYHQPWLKNLRWPRWMIYYLWAPLTGNTVWQTQLMRFLSHTTYYYFLRPVYFYIFRKLYFYFFAKIPLFAWSYFKKITSYLKTIVYFYGFRKIYFHVLCPFYWHVVRLVPILIQSYFKKLVAYTVTLIWVLRIPDLPGLTRMWFWKCIPMSIRRKNLYRLWQKYIIDRLLGRIIRPDGARFSSKVEFESNPYAQNRPTTEEQ